MQKGYFIKLLLNERVDQKKFDLMKKNRHFIMNLKIEEKYNIKISIF
jgi:hypothetical protein